MTQEEMNEIARKYYEAFGNYLAPPPVDYGFGRLSAEEVAKIARQAIAAGKPIDWRAILGPPVQERGAVS